MTKQKRNNQGSNRDRQVRPPQFDSIYQVKQIIKKIHDFRSMEPVIIEFRDPSNTRSKQRRYFIRDTNISTQVIKYGQIKCYCFTFLFLFFQFIRKCRHLIFAFVYQIKETKNSEPTQHEKQTKNQ